ncbi:MAG: MBL fold metallo-hydrolase [Bacteroidales bacterium]|nr:MBL fold metallo-hydrolase [Bacteroidales bacterium]
MELFKIEAGNFKLDGGSMFGVVPKSLWNRIYPADENNMCNLATRCLLVKTDKRLILIDTGLGTKQSEKFFSYYYLNGNDSLQKSLLFYGFSFNDITDLILTHLHFDHCGGAVSIDETGNYNLTFPNASYWVSKKQLDWTLNPNQREKPSFLSENIDPIKKSKKLIFADEVMNITNGIHLKTYNGHTEGLIVPFIHYKDRTVVYVSDLFPTAAHIPPSWVCGFDIKPLISMKEHTDFLEDAVKHQYILFFEHDIYRECCTVKKTEKGIVMADTFSLDDI